MARFHRPNIALSTFTVACGATDQTNAADSLVPGPNATLIEALFTTKTAGTGTGTFSVQVKQGSTNLSPASATTFIDADAVADTFHGEVLGAHDAHGVEGKRIGIATVKSGTVSADATLIVTLVWQL